MAAESRADRPTGDWTYRPIFSALDGLQHPRNAHQTPTHNTGSTT